MLRAVLHTRVSGKWRSLSIPVRVKMLSWIQASDHMSVVLVNLD